MGIYLNPGAGKLKKALNSEIYVDKSGMLAELNRLVNTEQCYICVSRPRRFGKSMVANLISAYYDHTVDDKIFAGMKIAAAESYRLHRGKYDVIKINMQEFLSNTPTMEELLKLLKRVVCRELQRAHDEVDFMLPDSLMFTMQDVYAATGRQFVIIIDEWDCIFREKKNHRAEQDAYLDFLRDWLKDKEYVALAYMTGILPIKKYGTHSALNMFSEFSMLDQGIMA